MKGIAKLTGTCCILLINGCASTTKSNIQELTQNREKWHGKIVEVSGFIKYEWILGYYIKFILAPEKKEENHLDLIMTGIDEKLWLQQKEGQFECVIVTGKYQDHVKKILVGNWSSEYGALHAEKIRSCNEM